MLSQLTSTCVLLTVFGADLHLQLQITVVRKDNEKAVANAVVRVEAFPGREEIQKGKTDKNGVFVLNPIPNQHKQIYIHIFPPVGLELKQTTEIHQAKNGAATIRIRKVRS